MMIHTTVFVFLFAACVLREAAEAFVVNGAHCRSFTSAANHPGVVRVLKNQATTKSTDDGDTASVLVKLQHEYKELQEKLLSDLVLKHDAQDAIRVEERMIEVLAEASAVERHELAKDVQEANAELEQSIGHLDHDFKEIAAMQKAQAAKVLLERLEENEIKLAATQARLRRAEKHDDVQKHAQEATEHHRSFLNKVKDAIYAHPDLLVSMDPHIL